MEKKSDMLAETPSLEAEPLNTLNNILVVDDHPVNLLALSQILQTQGYKVRKATSGAMALETVRAQAPDLVLLDIRMSPMNGFEVCEALKRSPHTCHIPILFITASDEERDRTKAFEVGGADYITKPFRSQEVLVRVSYQLQIQQQQQALTVLRQQVQSLNIQIEQRVQAQTQALQSAVTELQQLHQLKDDFITMLARELGSPTTAPQTVLPLLQAASQKGKEFFQTLSNVMTDEPHSNYLTQCLQYLQPECKQEQPLS
ncbi:MAG: response regulator [Leptolyngbya sp. BL-A-14]